MRLPYVSIAVLYFASFPLLAQPDPATVRLATVMVPATSGLLRYLLPDFEKQSGYHVQVFVTTQDIYDVARSGAADLVISHYGFPGVEQFVLDGSGQWPHPIFASQAVLLGPPNDPASVHDAANLTEALRRIAATKSPFVANSDVNVAYVVDVTLDSAGQPDLAGWYRDTDLEGSEAVESAAALGGYMVWGVDPFLMYQAGHHLNLEILFSSDPLLQRIMACIVVNQKVSPTVNVPGAMALQQYLTSPATQARIAAFRYPNLTQQFWWPAGQNN
jgi:tungstate transport system substrate-binding protein